MPPTSSCSRGQSCSSPSACTCNENTREENVAKIELGKGRGMRPDELEEFLTQTRIFAKVGTTKHAGWPYVNPVWYEYDAGAFYIITKELAGLTQNLRRDPRCAILVENPEPPYKRVLVLGEAGLDYFEATRNLPRVTIRVNPVKVTSWNGGGVDRTFHQPTQWHDVAPGEPLGASAGR